ncbi:cytochrome P450 [Ktedonospora formicarum]|uniref:Cytochrome P450 n=1 Tax=Ktedonospora formicarum TaxID=2778364 RepID=A0A8J3I613_9CHLR|nr:cytochrome P450 [Ktedonospora formicarum]GHO50987.1 cytochrome P450 [Ktedonospora formicarum]
MTQHNNRDHVQPTVQEEVLAYPFPLAEHSLEVEDPTIYTQLQAECPVARVRMPVGGEAVLLTRHADIVKAFTDPRIGTVQFSDGEIPRRGRGRGPGMGTERASLFTVSDARHNKIRRLVTQWFTVKASNELALRVEEVTNELVDAMERSGPPADLFEDYAIKTPMTVICELLGVPSEDEPQFRQWARVLFSVETLPEEASAQWQKMAQYMLPLIEQERKQPRNNVLGTLVKAQELGDEALTQEEMLSFATGLIIAGFETVSTTFTNSAFILLQRPELLAHLRERLDDPEYLAKAIEEILRMTPLGTAGRARIARDDLELSGCPIKKGDVLLLDSRGGNRDPEVFPHASEIDFERDPNPMITFGRGIHACLGQQIARMELRVLWSTLLKRLPTIRLAVPPSEVPWRPEDSATTGPAHLPVTW